MFPNRVSLDDVIAHMHNDGLTLQVKEGLVRLLLPYLMAGLGANITADYRAATLMIVTQLASQATLADSLLAGTASSAFPPSAWLADKLHSVLQC